MPPSAAEVINESIPRWAAENATKIAEIAEKYAWEGWAQIEIALALHRDMAAIAQADGDTLISVDREVRIWEDSELSNVSKDDLRVDLLVQFHREPPGPLNAIELKCWHWGSEYLEDFFKKRAMADVAKLARSRLREKYYRAQGCNLWMVALAVVPEGREYKLPEGFYQYQIPVAGVAKSQTIVIGIWRVQVDTQGELRQFG